MAYTTIDDPSAYFQTKLYTGNGGTQSITGVGFQPDLLWIRNRFNSARTARAIDSVRGVGKLLNIAGTADEDTQADTVTSFDSDGFSLGADSSEYGVNDNTGSHVAWSWKAGGSASSNTDGSITSTVSANTTAGFSIVKFTASGSGDQTIGHGLGVKPKMVITKVTSTTGPWNTYNENLNSSAPEDYYLNLASTNGSSSDSPGVFGAGMTTSTIGVGVGVGFVSGQTYVAYCFAEKQGYSKFGSYTGNGNDDGSYIHLGFKPAWFMMKNTASGNNWHMMDNKRDSDNVVEQLLKANASDAENTTSGKMDFLSNGVKIRSTSTGANGSGATYIYIAFAKNPFVTSTGIPTCAR